MVNMLTVTDEMRRRIEAVEAALAIYMLGGESASVVELPKLALADVVLREVRRQTPPLGRRA